MLRMKRIEDETLLADLFSQNGLSLTDTSAAFGVWERDELAGFCLYLREEPMRFLRVRCEDALLLDGLVRATLNCGSLEGLLEADFLSLPQTEKEKLQKLGYFQKEPLPIEWFFATNKPCHQMG